MFSFFFFFNDTATTEIYTLSLHDALPIYFVEPTIFDGVTNTMKIAREEIFGPVLSVIPFKSVEAGIAEGNETTYGLAAAVWTRDVAKALKAARAIRAGTVWVNAYNLYDAALPFGGFRESGFGREMGSVPP